MEICPRNTNNGAKGDGLAASFRCERSHRIIDHYATQQDSFLVGRVAGEEFQLARFQGEFFGQEFKNRLVGFAFFRRGGHCHAQVAVVDAASASCFALGCA